MNVPANEGINSANLLLPNRDALHFSQSRSHAFIVCYLCNGAKQGTITTIDAAIFYPSVAMSRLQAIQQNINRILRPQSLV